MYSETVFEALKIKPSAKRLKKPAKKSFSSNYYKFLGLNKRMPPTMNDPCYLNLYFIVIKTL